MASARKIISEFCGTATLVCVVVGSGIMGSTLSPDLGTALIINTMSTILALALLIFILGPVSSAHFNPAVTVVEIITRRHSVKLAGGYILAQIAGAISGAIIANVMFDLPAVGISTHDRVSPGTLLAEVLATAGLIIVIGVLVTRRSERFIPVAVAAWIGSAYFFTSSTSFANPAVTIGRIFTDTFAGIAPGSVAPFIAAQLVGAVIGVLAVAAITRSERESGSQGVN